MGVGTSSFPPEDDSVFDGLTPWPRAPEEARWFVDANAWQPSSAELGFLISLLPSAESTAVLTFRSPMDQKRAVLSRMLQRHCIATSLQLPHERVVVARTMGGKPFEASGVQRDAARSNFNFNVSHEGHLVVLASDVALLIGIDVSAPFELRGGPPLGDFNEVRRSFANTLTEREWAEVEAAGGEAERVRAFRNHWSLKEAFVKARGDGLGFALQRVEFCPCNRCEQPLPEAAGEAAGGEPGAGAARAREDGAASQIREGSLHFARVYVDGELQRDWRCARCELSAGHVVSVARGPISCAQDARGDFSRTLARQIPPEEHRARLVSPPPPFQELCVRQLVPAPRRAEYDSVVRNPTANSPYSVAWDTGLLATAASVAAGPPKMPEWFNSDNIASNERTFEEDVCLVS
mmetsp:Transcript_22151/g.45232  ORF Transcript_22151/g.45232 Transcript_22151/m.45232 type:complete len:407 (+) Transcript_22151:100-1320(+)